MTSPDKLSPGNCWPGSGGRCQSNCFPGFCSSSDSRNRSGTSFTARPRPSWCPLTWRSEASTTGRGEEMAPHHDGRREWIAEVEVHRQLPQPSGLEPLQRPVGAQRVLQPAAAVRLPAETGAALARREPERVPVLVPLLGEGREVHPPVDAPQAGLHPDGRRHSGSRRYRMVRTTSSHLSAWAPHRHLVAGAFAEQRSAQRRFHAHAGAAGVNLVRPDNLVRTLGPGLVLESYPGAEPHPSGIGLVLGARRWWRCRAASGGSGCRRSISRSRFLP